MAQVQRSLAAPVPSKTEKEVPTIKSQTFTAAPALSRALARVLSATESKENEAETRHSDCCLDDFTTREEAGKMQWLCYFFTLVLFRQEYVVQYINHQPNLDNNVLCTMTSQVQ